MTVAAPGVLTPVAGRDAESAVLLALVDGACHHRASALLASGEAGVGKTALVRQAARAAADRCTIVWATCLPLRSLATPLLPLRTALRKAGTPGVGPDWSAADKVLEFDAWLDRTTADNPLLLVVDDVHWADQSSLDVLMYVLAGQADRAVGVVLTMPTGEESSAPGLRRWLADVRRLPPSLSCLWAGWTGPRPETN